VPFFAFEKLAHSVHPVRSGLGLTARASAAAKRAQRAKRSAGSAGWAALMEKKTVDNQFGKHPIPDFYEAH